MNYEHMAKSTPIKKGTAKLEAELAKAWRDIETLSVVELAGRNDNVSEYVKHWEGRATKAEQQAEADAALMRQTLEALESVALAMPFPVARMTITALRKRLEASNG